jgi:hypothetical protein
MDPNCPCENLGCLLKTSHDISELFWLLDFWSFLW